MGAGNEMALNGNATTALHTSEPRPALDRRVFVHRHHHLVLAATLPATVSSWGTVFTRVLVFTNSFRARR